MMDIQAWLQDNNITADAYDADGLLENFLAEMGKGLDGGDSSLAMIPAYVGIDGEVTPNKRVAVIDAGGTNLRVCLVKFDDQGAIDLSHFSKQPMPGRDREIPAAEFYKVVADALEPFKDEFDSIGFCFSYPAEITPDLDGVLLHWTKEIKIPEMVGKKVGAGLVTALEARGFGKKNVVVLNDTVACLLAGMARGQAFNASSYIGFILGTGTNTAYVERNERIGKIELSEGAQVINVESGGFAAYDRSSFDRALDLESEDPGSHLLEKALSGVYLGAITLKLLKALVAEGAFSVAGGAAMAAMDELYIVAIDNLAANNGRDIGVLANEAFTEADHEVMRAVFNGLVDRAALLTAANICAAVVKSGAGTDPARPVCVNIDGSTYYYTFQMPEKVQGYLQPMLDARGLSIRCVRVDDAPVAGAAIAGLTSF